MGDTNTLLIVARACWSVRYIYSFTIYPIQHQYFGGAQNQFTSSVFSFFLFSFWLFFFSLNFKSTRNLSDLYYYSKISIYFCAIFPIVQHTTIFNTANQILLHTFLFLNYRKKNQRWEIKKIKSTFLFNKILLHEILRRISREVSSIIKLQNKRHNFYNHEISASSHCNRMES